MKIKHITLISILAILVSATFYILFLTPTTPQKIDLQFKPKILVNPQNYYNIEFIDNHPGYKIDLKKEVLQEKIIDEFGTELNQNISITITDQVQKQRTAWAWPGDTKYHVVYISFTTTEPVSNTTSITIGLNKLALETAEINPFTISGEIEIEIYKALIMVSENIGTADGYINTKAQNIYLTKNNLINIFTVEK